ncbi:MAG: zinc-binding dehydrogenase [Nannocystaceae bacterium]
MRKVVIHRPGTHKELKLETSRQALPGPGEVRIRVCAIGVNYADCVVRMGLYASAREFVGWPITPGFEVAGVVDVVGDGVDAPHLTPGARVVAVTLFGGYASEVVVPAHQVFACPENLSLPQAAAIPSVFLTGYYALYELAAVREGQDVLIHSAAGGVGGAMVQLARRVGCRVVGVVGASHKIKRVRDLGIEDVIDKSTQALWPTAEKMAPGGYQTIADANGVATLADSYEHLAPTGRLIVYGFHTMLPKTGRRNWLKLGWNYLRTPKFDPMRLTNENRSVMGFNLSYMFENRDLLARGLGELLDWFADGSLTAPPVTEYALEDVARAHQDLESAQTVGKLVLRCEE